jgi:plasmid stabilization system protein ParE
VLDLSVGLIYAEYIALDNLVAAGELVAKIFKSVDRLERFPNSGRVPPELPDSVYREVVSSPCRIFHRKDRGTVFILHVMRDEIQLKKLLLGDENGS